MVEERGNEDKKERGKTFSRFFRPINRIAFVCRHVFAQTTRALTLKEPFSSRSIDTRNEVKFSGFLSRLSMYSYILVGVRMFHLCEFPQNLCMWTWKSSNVLVFFRGVNKDDEDGMKSESWKVSNIAKEK